MIGQSLLARRAPRLMSWPVIAAVALVAIVALASVNLAAYPATWFDEGQYLHVPKALLEHGVYADWSSEGPRYYGPTTAAGPTVLLPIAAVYALFGDGLLQARLVMAVYLLACLALCFVVAERIHGRATAIVATALLLSSRGVATLEWGRQVLGEIPTLTFLLAGLYFWQRGLTQRRTRDAIAAGVCWGLCLITKNQAIVAFSPAIVALSALDMLYYRNARWSLRLLPPLIAGGMAGLWLIVMFALLGPGTLAENLALTRKAAGGAIIVLSPDAIARGLKFLASPRVFAGLLIPALIFSVWRGWRHHDVEAQSRAAVTAICVIWLAWFVCSLAWPRYAYVGAAVGALPVAALIVDAAGWARRRNRRLIEALIWIGCAAIVVIPLSRTTYDMLTPDRSVLRFADYLDREVPLDAEIETWEPELGGITDHRYHYPPQALLDVAVRHEWRGEPPARFDLSQSSAPYLIIGPFGAWTGVYASDQVDRWYAPIHEDGPYTLYRRQQLGSFTEDIKATSNGIEAILSLWLKSIHI